MIGIQNLRLKNFRSVCDHFWSHRIGEVHRQKRDINILEIFHFRNIFRITGDIDSFITESDDIAVTLPFRMESLLKIVGGNCFDFQTFDYFRITVLHDYAAGNLLSTCLCQDQLSCILFEKIYGFCVEMITMLVSH